MPFIAPLRAGFRQSTSPDVVSNRVRILEVGEAFSYDEPAADIPVTPPEGDGFTYIDLAPLAAGQEGVRDVYITAVDGRGNESDPFPLANTTFDFSPPAPPTEGFIES